MNCKQCWTRGGPEPPNTWSRATIPCMDTSRYTRDELDMRRKAEVLQYKQNSLQWTKKQKISYLSKNPIGQPKQNMVTPIQQLLFNYGAYTPDKPSNQCVKYNGIYMINVFDQGEIFTPPSASNVPFSNNNEQLYYDTRVPLTNWKRQPLFANNNTMNVPVNILKCS